MLGHWNYCRSSVATQLITKKSCRKSLGVWTKCVEYLKVLHNGGGHSKFFRETNMVMSTKSKRVHWNSCSGVSTQQLTCCCWNTICHSSLFLRWLQVLHRYLLHFVPPRSLDDISIHGSVNNSITLYYDGKKWRKEEKKTTIHFHSQTGANNFWIQIFW